MQATRVWSAIIRGVFLRTMTAYHWLHGRLQILLNAFAVEYVPALCLDGVLGKLIAQTADCTLASILLGEDANIILTAKDKIWVASHLSHSSEPVEEGQQRKLAKNRR